MSEIVTSRKCSGHRYNWCPQCDELWIASRMLASGVDCCPACEGPVLPYIGRSPYDVSRPRVDDAPRSGRQPRETDGLLAARWSTV